MLYEDFEREKDKDLMYLIEYEKEIEEQWWWESTHELPPARIIVIKEQIHQNNNYEDHPVSF